jgi:hypothetical protein
MDMNGEAIMHDMINNGGEQEDADYDQYEETWYEDGYDGYSIDN